jgi:drug/metabolite transporter (DMT)-like permease
MPTLRSGTAGLGVGLYLLGVGLFAINDALGKWLVKDYGVGQLMMLRSIGAVIVLGPMIPSLRVNVIDPRQARLQALRILVAAIDTFSFYYATRFMPLADVMTFYMATPLIVTALSAPLLGEKVERFRWIAVLVGFVGVVIALRPSPQMVSWIAPLALFGAVMFALSQTITRELRGVHWLPLVLWQFVGSGLIGAATVPFAWTTPTAFDLGLMALVGVVSMFCFIFIIRALALARAAAAAIFGDPVGGAHGLAGLARRPDPADHPRQCGHHRQRPIRGGKRQDGRGGGRVRRLTGAR